METPAAQGFRMPAEWEKHEATWISWPKDPNTFPPEILPQVESAYAKMVMALGSAEEVRILVDDEKSEERVRTILGQGPQVRFYRIRSVDVWVRDYGPTYVKGSGMTALVKWKFNAWGRKYDDLLPDEEAGASLARSTGLRVFSPGVVLEGGSIDVNGAGTLLTTEQCLLNKNRNPEMGRGDLERVLRDYAGVSKVVWLRDGIAGDDTDGHVDDIARFVSPKKVAVAVEGDEDDPNHRPLKEDLGILEASALQDGSAPEIVRIPMPDPVEHEGTRLPASHLNFYIGNGAVVVPTFGGESDKAALQTLEEAFPGRDVVGVDCRALVYGLGTLHCVTQQAPAP